MDRCVAIASCDLFAPDGYREDRVLLDALAAVGVAAEIQSWSDPAVDWDRYGLTVLRSTWDYTSRRSDFLAWAERVPRLANPAAVVRANSDKRYLAALQDAGIPVVPTTFFGPDEQVQLPGGGEFVIKPSVGAGSRGAGRFDAAVPGDLADAAKHAEHLQGDGRTVMVQPYLTDVDAIGETALIFIEGRFSHAICKSALLPPDTRFQLTEPGKASESLFIEESISPRVPSAAEREVAERVLAHAVTEPLLYARVDLLPGPDGPVLIELELTEPSLFLEFDEAAPARLAGAIVARLG
ncbi:MAG TPA: hypothetical protein VHO01_12610 [Jatrophihabitans sp.]|nr:hypothetical protein [Jatrophihabitans sp.]